MGIDQQSALQKAPGYINKLHQILSITKEEDLRQQFCLFENAVDDQLGPLVELLKKDIRSKDVSDIQNHMSDVERYRERVVRFYALSVAFLDHCKSAHFLIPKNKSTTDFDREAYQKNLTHAFKGMSTYLEGLITSIDSRVNMAKKLTGLDG